MARTKSKDRCPSCVLRRTLCICDRIPRLELRTRIVVLMHRLETKTTTNTGRLATLALPNSEIRLRGMTDQPNACEGLIVPDRQTLLLFPSDDSRELTKEHAESFGKPIDLVVPDGSWKQAAKVRHREPALESVPRVRLPVGPPSEYRLRISPRPEAVSTFEAIARALGILEGPEVQKAMEEVFRLFVDRTLWSRGRLQPHEVFGGITEEAFLDRQGKLDRPELPPDPEVFRPGWAKRG